MRAIPENETVGYPADFPGPGCVAMADPYSQFVAIAELGLGLSTYYEHIRKRPEAFVVGNMELHYNQPGEPVSKLVPDLMVVFGAAGRPETSYRIWEQGKVPDFVLEVISRSTQKRDRTEKKAIYESIGVREYWLFDPTGAYLEPRLRGYYLERDKYVPLRPIDRRAGNTYWSEVLGLRLRVEGASVQLSATNAGENLPAGAESIVGSSPSTARALRAAEAGKEAEARARRAAEAAREAEARARREAKAASEADSQARREAEAGREAEAQARREAEAGREAEAQARREAEAGREAEAQARREAEVRVAALERRLEVWAQSQRTEED